MCMHREGIVRFCTEKYSKPDLKNLSLSCMHLTNYAVNKHNGKFEFNTNADETDRGHKWTLTSLFSSLAASGHDTQKLHRQISQLVVMTIIAINPLLVHNYEAYLPEDESGRACFELLGMDVLLDEKCKPWLLEVMIHLSFLCIFIGASQLFGFRIKVTVRDYLTLLINPILLS